MFDFLNRPDQTKRQKQKPVFDFSLKPTKPSQQQHNDQNNIIMQNKHNAHKNRVVCKPEIQQLAQTYGKIIKSLMHFLKQVSTVHIGTPYIKHILVYIQPVCYIRCEIDYTRSPANTSDNSYTALVDILPVTEDAIYILLYGTVTSLNDPHIQEYLTKETKKKITLMAMKTTNPIEVDNTLTQLAKQDPEIRKKLIHAIEDQFLSCLYQEVLSVQWQKSV